MYEHINKPVVIKNFNFNDPRQLFQN
jgi:hypothetical protein